MSMFSAIIDRSFLGHFFDAGFIIIAYSMEVATLGLEAAGSIVAFVGVGRSITDVYDFQGYLCF